MSYLDETPEDRFWHNKAPMKIKRRRVTYYRHIYFVTQEVLYALKVGQSRKGCNSSGGPMH